MWLSAHRPHPDLTEKIIMKNIMNRQPVNTMKHFSPLLTLSALSLCLSGCQSLNKYVPNFISPHKVEIQQGNVITPEQVAQLKEGMTRDQVRFLLGTPLLSDIFHTNRWDYLFRLKKADQTTEEYKLTVFFDENRLRSYTTTLDVPKSDTAVAAADAPPEPVAPAPVATVDVNAVEVTAVPASPAPSANDTAPVAVATEAPAQATPVAADAANATNIDGAAEQAAVRSVIESWRAAWSGKDVKTYLSHYARSFKPQDVKRSVWEVHRKIALTAPKTIKVTLDDIEVTVLDAGHASAQFRQDYKSERLTEAGRKTLTLVKESGQWKIAREQFSK